MRSVIVFTILFLFFGSGVGAEPVWPRMREFEISFGVNFTAARNDADIPLYDTDGEIRYWLFCRGDYREIDESEARRLRGQGKEVEDNPYVSWWPLTCYLAPGAERLPEESIGWAIDTLLAPLGTSSRPYQTRAHVSGYDLVGACGKYPEYGRVRHFRLRGFELAFEFMDVEVSSGEPDNAEYAVMQISLRRDSEAQTARAEFSGYVDPFRLTTPPQPRSCDRPLEGKAPSSCIHPVTGDRKDCKPEWAYEPSFTEERPYAVDQSDDALEQTKERRHTRQQSVDWTAPHYLEEGIKLARQAAQARDGEHLGLILPEIPFALFCGEMGTPEWEAIRVDDMGAWNRLWRAMLAHEAFDGFEDLTVEEADLSPNYGIWIRGGIFRFQDGLTVATAIPCDSLLDALH